MSHVRDTQEYKNLSAKLNKDILFYYNQPDNDETTGVYNIMVSSFRLMKYIRSLISNVEYVAPPKNAILHYALLALEELNLKGSPYQASFPEANVLEEISRIAFRILKKFKVIDIPKKNNVIEKPKKSMIEIAKRSPYPQTAADLIARSRSPYFFH